MVENDEHHFALVCEFVEVPVDGVRETTGEGGSVFGDPSTDELGDVDWVGPGCQLVLSQEFLAFDVLVANWFVQLPVFPLTFFRAVDPLRRGGI